MPLGATHIKFALDFREKQQVVDLDKYLSGSVYPDSRYITKIERELTHNKDLLLPNFGTSDFKKGWAMHFVCDRAFNKITDRIFSELFSIRDKTEYGTDWWINKTVIKVILDVEVLKKFEIQQYLSALDYVENPNNESIDQLKLYNRLMQDLYSKNSVSIEDVGKMLLKLGIEENLVKKVTQKSREEANKQEFITRINDLFNEMLSLGSTD